MPRIVLITRGIGAAISTALKAAGHTVIANYAGNDAAAEALHRETGIAVRKWNVADFAASQAAVAAIAAEFGGVEVLVNNAGIASDATLHKMTPQQWQSVIDVDLTGVFNMSRAVIENMRSRNFGRIVNVSSVNAQAGQFGQTNYAAAKAGVIGFTKALALESAAHGITVNAVAPGYTATAMVEAVPAKAMTSILSTVPVGRLAEPDEIARLILFLAADESGFITGATYPINGGKYMA